MCVTLNAKQMSEYFSWFIYNECIFHTGPFIHSRGWWILGERLCLPLPITPFSNWYRNGAWFCWQRWSTFIFDTTVKFSLLNNASPKPGLISWCWESRQATLDRKIPSVNHGEFPSRFLKDEKGKGVKKWSLQRVCLCRLFKTRLIKSIKFVCEMQRNDSKSGERNPDFFLLYKYTHPSSTIHPPKHILTRS
jgi:hypothetical protein